VKYQYRNGMADCPEKGGITQRTIQCIFDIDANANSQTALSTLAMEWRNDATLSTKCRVP
jgi:hypothetical protein